MFSEDRRRSPSPSRSSLEPPAARVDLSPRSLPVPLLLFLVFQGLYGVTASGRVDRVFDESEVYLQVQGLWDDGSQALPDELPEWFGRVGRGGRRYAPYGPGAAFAALPHHALGRAVAAAAGVPREEPAPWTHTVAAVTSLATSTWAALAVVALFLAGRALGAGVRAALLPAVLLGAGTLLWPYATTFYSEAVSAALLMGAVALHLRGQTLAAGAALLALLLVKATNVVFAPALLALAWLEPGRAARPRPWRAVGTLALAAVAAGLIHAEWNSHRFGDPFELGYDWSEMVAPGAPPAAFRLRDLPRGLLGLLASPGKSLFLFAPPLLLLLRPRALAAFARARPDVAAAAGLGVAAALVFYGSYMYWEGGYAFGPRHLVPLLPLLLLPLARMPPPPVWAVRGCLVAGLAVGFLGVTVSFVEDQAMGRDLERPREAYYRYDVDAPPGRPRNVYRLDYSPLVTYPPRLVGHLRRPATRPGEGLEFLRAHLQRVRWSAPGGRALPRWLPPVFPVAFVLLLVVGLQGLRSRRPWAGAGATTTLRP